MTDVRRLLEAVRSELRDTVLPKVDGDYERSVVIAMLGILRDLAGAVVPDQRPARDAAVRLRREFDAWIGALGGREPAGRLAALVRASDETVSADGRYERLLEAAEILVRELWNDPELEPLRERILPRIRSALKTPPS